MWSKVWVWIKKYWKWLLFPVGITSVVLAYLAGTTRTSTKPAPPDLGQAGEDALDDVEEANRVRDEQLEELRIEHHLRLRDLTEEQAKELRDLQEKPVEDVVAWFNKMR